MRTSVLFSLRFNGQEKVIIADMYNLKSGTKRNLPFFSNVFRYQCKL